MTADDTDVGSIDARETIDVEPDSAAGPPSTTTRQAMRALPVVAAALPLAVYGIVALSEFRSRPMLHGDVALLEMWTRSAFDLDAYVGPYSRFVWNHPGPTVFYWFAPFYALSGQAVGGLGVATVVSSLAAVSVAGIAVYQCRGGRGGWTFAAVTLVFWIAAGTDWFDNFWNPVVVVLPAIAVAVMAAAVADDRPWWLPGVFVGASFSAQTHLGSVPVVATFVILAVVATGLQARRRLDRWVRPMIVAVGATGVMWLLPLYEQVTRSPGNMTQLIDFNRNDSGSDHTIGTVLDVVAVQFTLTGNDIVTTALLPDEFTLPAASWWRSTWLVVLLAIAIGCAVLTWRSRRWFETVLTGGGVIAAGLLTLSLTRVTGELNPYLTLTALSVGFALHLGIALTAIWWLAPHLTDPRLRRLVPTAIVGAAIIVASSVIWGGSTEEIVARRPSEPNAEVVVRLVDAELQNANADRVLIVVDDGDAWPESTLVANQLERRGIDTATTPDQLFAYGDQRTSNGCEQVAVRLSAAPPSDPSRQVLGQIGDTTVSIAAVDRAADCS